MCHIYFTTGFPGGASGKEPTSQCRRHKRCGFHSWVGQILWRRAWQPTPAFLPGEPYGQRSLVGYSPCGHKDSDMTEVTKQQQPIFYHNKKYKKQDLSVFTSHSSGRGTGQPTPSWPPSLGGGLWGTVLSLLFYFLPFFWHGIYIAF